MEKRELFRRIQRGNYANVRFRDFVSLVEQFGIRSQRISGSHHIFWHPRSRVRLNIQPMGGDAKPSKSNSSFNSWNAMRYDGKTMTSDYHINIFYSQEDGGYIADLPDFEYCSAFGATPEEALAELRIAKEAWLESARESGDPIPEARYRPLLYQLA